MAKNCWEFKKCGREKVELKLENLEYARHIPIMEETAGW